MILSQLTKAIREQNWFAVLVEFVIVILGVVIGFQITSWNAEQQRAQAGERAIEDLLAESEAIVRYIQEDIDRVDIRLLAMDKVIAALSSGDASSLEPGDMNEGLDDIREYRGIRPPRSVYDNLSGSGGLNTLNNEPVVSALASYYATLENVHNATDLFQFYIINDHEALSRHPGVLAYYDPERPARRSTEYDFEALASDPDTIEDLVNQVESQITFQFIRLMLRGEAQSLCDVLAEVANQPCDPFPEDD